MCLDESTSSLSALCTGFTHVAPSKVFSPWFTSATVTNQFPLCYCQIVSLLPWCTIVQQCTQTCYQNRSWWGTAHAAHVIPSCRIRRGQGRCSLVSRGGQARETSEHLSYSVLDSVCIPDAPRCKTNQLHWRKTKLVIAFCKQASQMSFFSDMSFIVTSCKEIEKETSSSPSL